MTDASGGDGSVSVQARRVAAFRALHESGCFVLPNPWDIGTARYLSHLGFPALATTSSGFAFGRGLPDTDWAVPRDAMLGHIAEIAAATDLPVNADFESGYARDPEGVAESVRLCCGTGIAGLSIEDSTGDPAAPLFENGLATDRIRAARAAIDESGSGVLLTGRAECFLVGHSDPLTESLRRIRAYAEAGAEVLYVPGVRKPDDIRAVVEAAEGRPVNLLVSGAGGLSVAEAAALGIRRISLGSGLARAAWGAFIRGATTLAQSGEFGDLAGAVPFDEINGFFRRDLAERSGAKDTA
ncbi:isocitrate lyase/PEP mutase family protein [Enterovirga rhinocerotis]|uniref:2-methylisocitrate lyase-like PEP mutase family enzyme n=1 Tax=Enterovirga rhinocerotis TaxID=1339210 RepID=A0A4R7BRD6_9HYPH|nr:isocitrate lyase/phosphoenolpyruvate mutase family protein [Enterovirga rhinocerotis]TDR88208.1 2-methylisocitrate lyase-like PEP mutase family enzyme [Enterovirga rhinocerotis]